jgi:hypothetical protein
MEGTTGYWLTRLVLQRSLGVVYLIAFSVAVNQFRPLCGEKGLLPVGQFLRQTSLPNPLSWYFHWMPVWVHKAGVLFNHLTEVAAPAAFFAPQPFSAMAGGLTILFQGSLMVSGNFSWLNLLTLVLGFSTFNDAQLARVLPMGVPELAPATALHTWAVWGVALLVGTLSVKPALNLFSPHQIMNTSYNPLQLVNTYGAFGSITRERFEIVLEGSDEAAPATVWRAYEFKGKPGDPCRMPPQVAPYHQRLDWLMWFAAMPSPYYDPWFIHLVERVLQGDRATLALLKGNPFPDAPPRFVRATYYRYRFTTPAEHRDTGCWWRREQVGVYFPPVSLGDPSFRNLLTTLGWQHE